MITDFSTRIGLAGSTAVVIGGGGGIGAAVSLALAELGVNLVIGDIDDDAMTRTADTARAAGRQVMTQHCDVRQEADLDDLYDRIERDCQRLDIVINVAGGTHRGLLLERTAAQDAEDIRRNYGYVVHSYRRALPLIRQGGAGGSIVSFTTIEAHRGAASFAVYAGAKAATTNFTKAMAVELAGEGIRCNCIVPDTTPSQGNIAALQPEMVAKARALPPELQGKGREMYVPQGRMPMPEDLANGVVFLVSDLARSITGIDLHIDGGTKAAAGMLNWPYGDGFCPAPLAGTIAQLFGRN